jgi:hypothetical protein
MMRCLLHAADLGPEFWTFALSHAVYIKNRLPHTAIKCSPYEKFTGHKPTADQFKIFGSKIYSKKPGKRPYKLDHHTASGIFLGFSATHKNIRYLDDRSGRLKLATHVIFDEAHLSSKSKDVPLAAETLQRLGYYAREDWLDDIVEIDLNSNTDLLIQKLDENTTVPKRSTTGSIGYDLTYNGTTNIIINPR